MGHPKYSQEDFLGAALAIIAERGVSEVTVAAVSERLGSPTGSFYHRFASRDVLLGSLWLRAVLQFQTGIGAALDGGDGLKAALHTPAWVRDHPDEARVIFGKVGHDEVRLAQFLISELPVAVVRQHLLRGERPPPLVDRIIRATYGAVLADYRSGKTRSRTPKA